MIPLRAEVLHVANPDEPEAIRHLKKKALYKQLSEQWLLPDENSKGVNRAYLVAVYNARVFRASLLDYKRFEIELTPRQLKKTPFLNTADAYVKMERLLAELALPGLGFEIGAFPEDNWLYKIIRYVDRNNATGVYLEPIRNARVPDEVYNSPSSTMMRAKRNAERHLLEGIENVKPVHIALRSLWDCHKKEISRRREVEQLTRELEAATAKLTAERAAMNTALTKATMVVFTAGTGIQFDQLFLEGQNGPSPETRGQIQDITNM